MNQTSDASPSKPAEPAQAVAPEADRLADSPSARRPHVVLLNQPFYPDVAATAQMAKDLADHLVRSGFDVTAIASRSVYGKSGAALPRRESIAITDEHGEFAGTIEVHRVGASIFGKKGVLARGADFALYYALAGLTLITVDRPTHVIGFTTPPFVHLLAIASRWFRKSKAIHWLMDLYPDVAVECGVLKRGGIVHGFFERISRFLLKRSDRVVVLGRCMRDRVVEKGVDPKKIEHIPVWADHSELTPVEHYDNPLRKEWNLPAGSCCVMYSGNFGIAHEAQTICRAMERLTDRGNMRFVFVGGGKRRPEVEAFIADKALSNAAYYDYLPREELRFGLAAGDIHLISVRDGLEGLIVPSKLFGIMAAGRPAVYVGSPKSEIAQVIEETGCGVCVAEDDDGALAEAIASLATDSQRRQMMGEAGRKALAERFDTAGACEAWRKLLLEEMP